MLCCCLTTRGLSIVVFFSINRYTELIWTHCLASGGETYELTLEPCSCLPSVSLFPRLHVSRWLQTSVLSPRPIICDTRHHDALRSAFFSIMLL
jgi:hypothetical protein